jgi:hypothetical protein
LEPWLTFSSLLPFELDEDGNAEPLGEIDAVASVRLCAAFKGEFVPRPIEDRPVAFFQFILLLQRRHPPEQIPKLVRMYCDVRGLLEMLPVMRPQQDELANPLDELADHYLEKEVQVTHFMGIGANGRFYEQPDSLLQEFITAMKGLEADELARIKRCQVCGSWFYALRRNTQACHRHLALARVRRSREVPAEERAKRRRRYEENRKVNQRAKQYRQTEEKGLETGQAESIARLRDRTRER